MNAAPITPNNPPKQEPVTKPIPVRLKPTFIAQLDISSGELGLDRSSFIRFAATLLIANVESGVITLPKLKELKIALEKKEDLRDVSLPKLSFKSTKLE